MFKKEPSVVYVGKEKKQVFVDAVKFGVGFYIGFNLARMAKRLLIITNVSK